MSTSTFIISYAYTITYVTAKLLLTLKEIIREIGLDPSKLANDWQSYENAISTWLRNRELERITLEVYNPTTGEFVTRWDLEIQYASVGEDSSLWVDTAAVRYAIVKHGLVPSTCRYDIKVKNRPGYAAVDGWGPCEFRSTEGFKRYTIGATLGGNGLSAQTAYWSR
jgi:hypothetical protein